MKRKGFSIMFALGFASFLGVGTANQTPHVEHIHVHNNEVKKQTQRKENITTYEAEDGTHTLYWAQGVEAPKLSMDPSKIGTPGYFDIDKTAGYTQFIAPFEPNKGYYDLNKRDDRMQIEHPHCYLATASNILNWWMDQNKDLVDRYVDLLRTTDTYGNAEGLKQIMPFNQETWDKIQGKPQWAYVSDEQGNSYKSQELGITPLVRDILGAYYFKEPVDGFPSERVWDFFFNGYAAQRDEDLSVYPEINKESNYIKDHRGGYFYPIFEHHMLTHRLAGGQYKKYDWLRDNLADIFANGYGIGFAYNINAKISHAISLWGCEYDSNGELVRLYFTDSDDKGASNVVHPKVDEWTSGMFSYNIVVTPDGTATISNKDGATEGKYITDLFLLDLSRDEFEARLNDLGSPEAPEITHQTGDKVYALNTDPTLRVEANIKDTGTISYAWYVSNSPDDKGTLIPDSNKNYLKINNNEVGVKYYHCDVINNKNGKTTITESNRMKADVRGDIEAVNAAMPQVSWSTSVKYADQYGVPPKLTAFATSPDGGELSYQWYESSDSSTTNSYWAIPGATGPVYYPDTHIANPDRPRRFYFCVVTNTNDGPEISGRTETQFRPANSRQVKLTLKELDNARAPFVYEQPQNIEIKQQNSTISLDFKAKSTDGGHLSYQWYKVNSDFSEVILPNETSNILTLDASKVGSNMYRCLVTNTNHNASNLTEATAKTDVVTVEVTGEVIASTNNDLSNLVLNNAVLSPKFDKDTTSYTTTVGNEVSKIDLVATKADPKASINIENPNLEVGTNTITITVTSESGLAKVYTITVTREGPHVHEWGDWVTTKAPTCKEDGLATRTCKTCGETETKVLPKTNEHVWGEWEIAVEPTCTKPGSKQRTCSVCGEVEVQEIPATGIHEWGEWEVIKEPTCKEPGLEQRKCLNCDEVETREIPVISEHVWGDWIVTKEPTETEEGSKYRVCEICGEKEVVSIPKLEPTTPEPGTPEIPEKPAEPQDNSNIGAIIAGVTVPVVLIATIALVVILVKKGKK